MEDINMNPQAEIQEADNQLIDDVAEGKMPSASENRIGSIADAKQAFLQLLSDDREETAPVSETAEPETAPALPDTGTQTLGNNVFDEAKIQSMIQEELGKRIAEGEVPDFSAQNLSQAVTETVPQETAPDFTLQPENLDYINSDEFYEKFVENPGEAMQEVYRQMLNPTLEKLKPLLQQSETIQKNQKIIDTIKEFAESGDYGDFGDYQDDMVRILKEGGYRMDDVGAYRDAYSKAKINRLSEQLAQAGNSRTLEDYLGDEESVQKLAENPQLQQLIIGNYLSGLSKGGSPAMIGSSPTASAVATEPQKTKNFKDAGEKLKSLL